MAGDEEYMEEAGQPVRSSEEKDHRRTARRKTEGNVFWSYASNPVFPEYEGELTDINQLGLGFFSTMPIKEGSVIRLKAKGLWQDYRYATVMRCDQVDEGKCSNGLVFNLSLSFV